MMEVVVTTEAKMCIAPVKWSTNKPTPNDVLSVTQTTVSKQ